MRLIQRLGCNTRTFLPLYDSGEASGFLYYVMPYLEGQSLRDRLHRERQLPLDEALRITREVAGALAYAHAHDVVHRDIKPENILFSSEGSDDTGGHALIADFGIARAISSATEIPSHKAVSRSGPRVHESGTGLRRERRRWSRRYLRAGVRALRDAGGTRTLPRH